MLKYLEFNSLNQNIKKIRNFYYLKNFIQVDQMLRNFHVNPLLKHKYLQI